MNTQIKSLKRLWKHGYHLLGSGLNPNLGVHPPHIIQTILMVRTITTKPIQNSHTNKIVETIMESPRFHPIGAGLNPAPMG
jgi:hypothetical protein